MDLDSDLIQMQGGLMKANNCSPFKNLTSRGGNEDDIQNVVVIIFNILKGKEYISDDGANPSKAHILRKINLFLIFNSDLDILNSLVNNDDVGHLIWIAPTIPRCLLIHLVWGLKLDSLYCETIEHSCPVLSIELLRTAKENMKYSTPVESIVRTRHLIYAAYSMTVKILHNKKYKVVQKSMLIEIYDIINESLKFFTDPPNKAKMSNWSTNKVYLFSGRVLLNMLNLLNDCFSIFIDPGISRSDCEEFYFHTYEMNLDETEKIDNLDDIIKDYLFKFNDLLLGATKANFMAVNVDIYCSWSECFEDEKNEITLQTAIGELAYKLNATIESDTRLHDDLSSMLRPISCKPSELLDLINKADKDTLLKKAKEVSEDQKHWLLALVKSDYFFSDNECFECIQLHKHILPSDEIEKLFKLSVDHLYDTTTCKPKNLKELASSCFNTFSLDMKKRIILDVFSNKIMFDILELPDFDQNITAILNKLVEIDDNFISSLLSLFVQNPYKLYSKILVESSKNSKMLIVIKGLRHFESFHPIKYQISTNIVDLTSMISHVLNEISIECLKENLEKECYVTFIRELSSNKILDENIILMNHIIPAIDKYLESHELSLLHLSLQCLRVIYYPDKRESLVVPVLLMCAQILDLIRWDLETFSNSALNIIQETINIQQSVFPYLARKKKPTDREWVYLLDKVSFLTPINMIYYKQLLQKPHDIIDASLDEEKLKICLSYLLPRSTLEEWKTLSSLMADNRTTLENYTIFLDVLNLICLKAIELNTSNSFGCLEMCYRNFSILLIDTINTDDSIIDFSPLFQKIIKLQNSLPSSIKEGAFSNLLNLRRSIISKPNITISNHENIIASLENPQHREMLEKML